MQEDSRDREFGESAFGCCQNVGEQGTDAGWQFRDGEPVGIQVRRVEALRGGAEALPIEDGQFRAGEVGPVKVAVGQAPAAYRGVDADVPEVAPDGAVYVVLGDDAWAVVGGGVAETALMACRNRVHHALGRVMGSMRSGVGEQTCAAT